MDRDLTHAESPEPRASRFWEAACRELLVGVLFLLEEVEVASLPHTVQLLTLLPASTLFTGLQARVH